MNEASSALKNAYGNRLLVVCCASWATARQSAPYGPPENVVQSGIDLHVSLMDHAEPGFPGRDDHDLPFMCQGKRPARACRRGGGDAASKGDERETQGGGDSTHARSFLTEVASREG